MIPMSEPSVTEVPSSNWTGVATGAALALAVVTALALLGILAQGFAVQQDAGLLYKIGIAFLRNLDDTPIGLMALVAVVLLAAPAVGDVPADPTHNRRVAIAAAILLAACLTVIFGSVLGVVTRLHFDQGPGQAITSATRWVLATFVIRSMGPALVAFGSALAVLSMWSPRRVTPAPYAETGGTDPVDPESGPGAGTP
jgi:hypothetical protein